MIRMQLAPIFAAMLLSLAGCTTAAHEWRLGAPEIPRLGPRILSPQELDGQADLAAYDRGVAAAEANIALGKLHFRTFGLEVQSYPRPIYESRYDRILAKHGVAFENQGCEFDTTGEAKGYNQRIAQEVVARYGTDFWTRVDREARR